MESKEQGHFRMEPRPTGTIGLSEVQGLLTLPGCSPTVCRMFWIGGQTYAYFDVVDPTCNRDLICIGFTRIIVRHDCNRMAGMFRSSSRNDIGTLPKPMTEHTPSEYNLRRNAPSDG
jgi:hypothetical protein